ERVTHCLAARNGMRMLRQIFKAGSCLVVLAFLGSMALSGRHDSGATGYAAPKDGPASKTGTTLHDPEPPRGDWNRRWWMDKTARLLRGGSGLGHDDDIDALSRLTDE